MIAHLRIPNFHSRCFLKQDSSISKPIVVTDESRIIDILAPRSADGINSGDLLETITIPKNYSRHSFDLDLFKTQHEKLFEKLRTVAPIVEKFTFGEYLIEIDKYETLSNLINQLKLPDVFQLTGAMTATAWLSRILSLRQDKGSFTTIDDNQYETAVQTVKLDEFWGLGHELTNRLREYSVDNMAEIYHMTTESRFQKFGRHASKLSCLLEGQDPRPLNPFSKPDRVNELISVENEKSEGHLKNKISEKLQNISRHLKQIKCRTHRMELSLKIQNHEQQNEIHDFSNATDEFDILEFTARQLLSNFELPDTGYEIQIQLSTLVANTETYHSNIEERLDDLQII